MKLLIFTIIFTIAGNLGFGETYSVLLNNPEESSFYYVLNPPELNGFDPAGSVFLGILYDYFADDTAETEFKEIPPGTSVRVEGLSRGTHLLLGFFAVPGKAELPVRVVRILTGGGIDERFYTIYKEPSLINVRISRGRLKNFFLSSRAPRMEGVKDIITGFGISIDNRYEDWEQIPYLAEFSESFSPISFTREQYGSSFETFPIGQARHWREGGTQLNEIKAVDYKDKLYLYCSTRSAISDNLSIFLYFHGDRTASKENRVTLELLPARADKPGLAVLWVKGKEPALVGRLASGSFFLEAEIFIEKVYQALEDRSFSDLTTFDLTASYYDNIEIVYEEFFFATLSVKDIPAPEDL